MDSLVLIFIAIASVSLIVVILWYMRFRQNKGVAERVRRSPQSYMGPRAAGIYQIPGQDNRFFGYATPPPTFSKAVNYPLPPGTLIVAEEAPPTYDQYLILNARQVANSNQNTSRPSCLALSQNKEANTNSNYNRNCIIALNPDFKHV